MQPTLNPNNNENDIIIINRYAVSSRSFRTPKRGDVVIYKSPVDPQMSCVKRVIAIEGDRIKPREMDLNPFYNEIGSLSQNSETVTIPQGHCWVEGDNANYSKDSNNYGPVSASPHFCLILLDSCVIDNR